MDFKQCDFNQEATKQQTQEKIKIFKSKKIIGFRNVSFESHITKDKY